jgi:hypothetical protein
VTAAAVISTPPVGIVTAHTVRAAPTKHQDIFFCESTIVEFKPNTKAYSMLAIENDADRTELIDDKASILEPMSATRRRICLPKLSLLISINNKVCKNNYISSVSMTAIEVRESRR